MRAYDQEAMDRTSAIFPRVYCCREPYEVAKDADALLILTEWEEFRQLDWERIRDVMARPLVIDGRNLLNPTTMTKCGFEYYCFGRPIEPASTRFLTAHLDNTVATSVNA